MLLRRDVAVVDSAAASAALLLFVVAAAQPNDPHVRLVLLLWSVRVDMDMTHADMTERDRGTDRRRDGRRTAVGAAVLQFVGALRCEDFLLDVRGIWVTFLKIYISV